MRKISLQFKKYAIFILYGLLQIALITLAQEKKEPSENNDCIVESLKPVPQEKRQVTIGYVQLFTSQPMDPNTIPWDKYDYINVIGKIKSDFSLHSAHGS